MTKPRFRRAGGACRALAMSLAALLLAVTPAGLDFRVRALTEAEINDELKDLQEEQQKLQDQIDADENAIDALKANLENLQQQVNLITSQINGVIDQLEELDQNLAEQDAAIAAKEQEIEDKQEANRENYVKLQERMRAVSKGGNLSALQMLLNTEDYADYLIKSKLMERITQSDQELIDEIDEEIRQLNEEKEALSVEQDALAAQRAIVDGIRKENEGRKRELDSLYNEINRNKMELQSKVEDNKGELEDLAEQEEELERQLQEISQKGDEDYDGKYTGGTMFWPVPTVRNISSPFGTRWGKLHKGIDIANGSIPVYGEEIVAAADGVVIYANGTNTWGGGYGYYTMVDHGLDDQGRKIVTLYAHCSKMYAQVGQQVVGGETVLALAGNTGNVTGPHLHFEVRVDGTPVDPIANGYVKLK